MFRQRVDLHGTLAQIAMLRTVQSNPRQNFHYVYGWLSRPDSEARTLCRAYARMLSDRASLSAGEVARKVAQYQNIRANLPDTQWLDPATTLQYRSWRGWKTSGIPRT
jgi:hypothetical protein